MKTTPSTLTISLLNDQLAVGDFTINLEPRTIYNGVILKPSEIVTKLSNYLKINNLKNPKAIICLPTTINNNPAMLPFFVLQYALVFAKTDIHITKITKEAEATNLLSILQPASARSPKIWLFITFFALSTLSVTIWMKNQEARARYINLERQQATLKKTNTLYEKKYTETHKLKNTIKQLKEKQATINDILKKRQNPTFLLTTLAHQTPASIWLTDVTFNQETKNPTPKNNALKKSINPVNLSIKGISLNTKAISQFIKNLNSKSSKIQRPILIHVGKEKFDHKTQTKTKNRYHFIIEGSASEGTQTKNNQIPTSRELKIT